MQGFYAALAVGRTRFLTAEDGRARESAEPSDSEAEVLKRASL
jgi:hypothetical protein